jgi:hypothetical protein
MLRCCQKTIAVLKKELSHDASRPAPFQGIFFLLHGTITVLPDESTRTSHSSAMSFSKAIGIDLGTTSSQVLPVYDHLDLTE